MNVTAQKIRFKLSTPLMHKLSEFWSWWIEELAGIFPKSVRAALLPSVERLYLQATATELIAHRATIESTDETGRYPLNTSEIAAEQAQALEELATRSREVVLCLPGDKVLAKTITLPLAAEENLRQVLGFEMDRQTPFSVDQVYYDYQVTSRDSRKNTITLDLLVTPKPFLDGLLSELDDIGFKPHQATICPQQAGQPRAVNLLPEELRQRRPDSARYFNLALGVVAVMLLLGVIALPLLNKVKVIEELEAKTALVTDKAEVARRLRDKVTQLDTDARFVVNMKQATPLALELINELTRILPDDTWINRLDIKGDEVQIQGQSASADALIPLIESSSMLQNPRFRSPVTRLPRTNTERFHLSADVLREPAS